MRPTRPLCTWIAAACALFSGCVSAPEGTPPEGTTSKPGQATFKTCTAPAFPTQLHVNCSADATSSGDLQRFESTFDLSNVAITETPSGQGAESSQVSGSVLGQASYTSSSGGAQNSAFNGDFNWAKMVANGEVLKLNLVAMSGIKMSASIQTYYASPAQVTWNGSGSTMSCQASYIYPANGQSQCQDLAPPTAAKLVCENSDAGHGPKTLSADLQISHATVEARNSGEVKWEMSGTTQGALTATSADGQLTTAPLEGGSLSVQLSTNGTATLSWSATLGATGGGPQGAIELSGIDTSGVVPGQVNYNGQTIPTMLCTLKM